MASPLLGTFSAIPCYITMKINFSGSYNELAKVLDLRINSGNAKAEKTDKALAEVSPFEAELSKTIDKTKEAGRLAGLDKGVSTRPEEPLAQLNLPDVLPPTSSLKPMNASQVFGGEERDSVKVPTLLRATRVDVAETTSLDIDRAGILSKEDALAYIQPSSYEHGVDPALSLAVAYAESDLNTNAVSQDGHASKGLFQLLDSTGKDLHQRLNRIGNYDPFDPAINADLGVSYLKHLHDVFSAQTPLPNGTSTFPAANSAELEKLAVAAYNFGEGNLASIQARVYAKGNNPGIYSNVETYLPNITRKYVARVLSSKSLY